MRRNLRCFYNPPARFEELVQFVGRERLEVREVKPQAIGRDQLPGLLDVIAHDLAQRR